MHFQELVDSRSQRQELKSELNKRRSLASQQRMRTIAQLAQEKGIVTNLSTGCSVEIHTPPVEDLSSFTRGDLLQKISHCGRFNQNIA